MLMKQVCVHQEKTSASDYYCRLYKRYWQGLIYQGQQNNPIEYSDKRKRKRNIARRLADRLDEYSEDFCRFFWDFRVPFDNNQAERDVRHAKVKIRSIEKPSAGFSSCTASFVCTPSSNILKSFLRQFPGIHCRQTFIIENSIGYRIIP